VTTPVHPRPPIDPTVLNGPGALTQWTNLGHWPRAQTYADAARELARRVGHAAHLRAGDVVVDYACGYGDSLKFWLDEFCVARVIGVEPDPSVTDAIRARVAEWGLADRIRVVTARAEDLLPTDAAADVTAVVCVDAAYHFATRDDWLTRTVQALPPRGRLGFSDLEVCARGARLWRTEVLARVIRMPSANLQTADDVEHTLTEAGARIVWSETAGEAVLDGFATHATGNGMPFTVTRGLIKLARRGRLVDYRIVGAERTA
jgi:cyclopropane fatty-acyl-phospholipid synthase-like methyltransferase